VSSALIEYIANWQSMQESANEEVSVDELEYTGIDVIFEGGGPPYCYPDDMKRPAPLYNDDERRHGEDCRGLEELPNEECQGACSLGKYINLLHTPQPLNPLFNRRVRIKQARKPTDSVMMIL